MRFKRTVDPTLQFALPVIFETVLSTFINLIFSSLIGGISGSSLTAISQCNMIVTLIVAAMSLLNTGSSVLCARLKGSGEYREASRVAEQTILLACAFSLIIMTLCLIFTVPLLSLVMPNAEDGLLHEAYVYFRVLILSLPFLNISNVLVGMLRASGDSRTSMVVNVSTCLMQLLFAFLFLRTFQLGVTGAGLTYLCCRLASMLLAVWLFTHSHRYTIAFRRILKPHFPTFRRIFALGIPSSVESIFVQAGYLVGSTMVIGLGSFEAAVYNVANTLYSFASLPQGIMSAIALTTTGQLIGSGDYEMARKKGWKLWRIGLIAVTATSLILFLLRKQLTPLYSSDPAVQTAAAAAILAALLMNHPGASLNTLNPQLSAGGDVRSVMYTTLIGVWLIRLPLTWLFCYHWTLGAPGVFLANAIALYVRAVLNILRTRQGKYLYMRV